jgi:hypothetical protein
MDISSFILLQFCVRNRKSRQRFCPVGLLGRCPVRTSPDRRNSLTGIFFVFCSTPRKFRVKVPIVSLTACYQFIGPNHPKIRRCIIQPPTTPLNKSHLCEYLVCYVRKWAQNWLRTYNLPFPKLVYQYIHMNRRNTARPWYQWSDQKIPYTLLLYDDKSLPLLPRLTSDGL